VPVFDVPELVGQHTDDRVVIRRKLDQFVGDIDHAAGQRECIWSDFRSPEVDYIVSTILRCNRFEAIDQCIASLLRQLCRREHALFQERGRFAPQVLFPRQRDSDRGVFGNDGQHPSIHNEQKRNQRHYGDECAAPPVLPLNNQRIAVSRCRQNLRERRVIRYLAKCSVVERDNPWRVGKRFGNAKIR
jgi:hypothetical protein